MSTMLNPSPNERPSFHPGQELGYRSMPLPAAGIGASEAVSAGTHSHISKGLCFVGEFSGSDPLFIDGKIEGRVNLPGGRVTVGHNGRVEADIQAREIVVLGKVRGNLSAADRVDIRANGAVSGDIVAPSVSIEDGAFFKGAIDIRKRDRKPGIPLAPVSASIEMN